MENSYGIGVTNRYALFLDDESDPLETLKLKEQEKELKKKTKVSEKENKGKNETAPKGKPAPNQKKVIKEQPVHKVQENKREDSKSTNPRTNADGKTERSFNKFNNENREERNNRRNREDRPYNGPMENNRDREDRPRREHTGDNFENRNRSGRPLNNKLGGPRGARGNRPFEDRRGKREFDRQSGSDKTRHGYRGVKSIDKREGGGAHNWGSHKDVIEEADKTNEIDQSWNENEKPEPPVSSAAVDVNKENDAELEAQPVEEEPKELTLDEWKAQKAGRLKPQYNLRKAGEGEDLSQWKKMYELNKKKDGDAEEEEEYDASDYPQRAGRQKHIDIDIHFYDSSRRGGPSRGRGSRAGPKGNRPNRDQRGNDKQGSRFRGNEEQGDERIDNKSAPKVDDERIFPSLG